MNKRLLFTAVAACSIMLAACAAPPPRVAAPTAPSAPTVAPTEAPAEAPTQVEPTQAATTQVVEAARVMLSKTKLGDVLAGPNGLTLYMFKKDANGESACYDQCAVNWPPLLTSGNPEADDGADAALLGTTTRTDGKMQVTYNGMPLYYFAGDAAPGDANGQEVGDVWYVVSANGTVVEEAQSEATAAAEATPAEGTAEGVQIMLAKTNLGDILVDAQGMTLYMFKKDANGESACYDQCAQNWPPLLSKDAPSAGDGVKADLLGTTTRTDGVLQVTYNGMPLYRFANDAAAGDTNGQGVGEVWYVLDAEGNIIE